VITAAVTSVAAVAIPPGGREQTVSYAFDDEFNGPAGSPPDPSKWQHETGRWTDNHELETYTDAAANACLDGQGHLVIKALKTASGYTSARLTTEGLFARNHGNFEARIRFDRATGAWPAWWMLGSDYPAVGWPRCGEIDMIEVYGQPGWSPDSTVHTADHNGTDTTIEMPVPGGVDTGWHTWHLRWDGNTGQIQFAKDGAVYLTVNPGELPNWPFGVPGARGGNAFMILNLAIGGDGGGPVPESFTQSTMTVDYVRVW
jgi:beta-glucanase (GH16 family)